MTDAVDFEHDTGRDKPKHVTIEVNNKPVVLPERDVTGTEIKQSAIQQGVSIESDFVLQLERPNGEFDAIGDYESVRVRNGMRFTAVAPDDNS